MNLRYYADVHIPRAVVNGLRLKGIEILTAQEDGTARLSDSQLLDRATETGRVLVTQDSDLLREGVERQRSRIAFAGVVYAHPLRNSIGGIVDNLELLAHATDLEEWDGRIEYLPLR